MKATNTPNNFFILLMTFCLLSGRPPASRRPSPSLRRPGRPGSPAHVQGCKLYERVYKGSLAPNRPMHLPTGCSRSLHRMSARGCGTQARGRKPGNWSSNPPIGHRDAKSRSTPQAAADRDVRQTRTAVLQVANLAISCAGNSTRACGRTHPEADRCGRGIEDPTSPQTVGESCRGTWLRSHLIQAVALGK